MTISPIYAGDTLVTLKCTFEDDDGKPYDVSQATFGITLKNILTNTIIIGAGEWTILDGPGGKAYYQWNIADVSTTGIYQVFVSITVDGRMVHPDPQLISIQPVI
jgi:hypothetical protein